MDLLVLAELDGVVDMTPEAIAARTRIPLVTVNRHLIALQSPDSRSRTPECEGRRLVLLDANRSWGWRIVNYQMYRDIRNETERREYMRDYMRNYRKIKACKQPLTPVNTGKPQLAKAEAEAEAEAPRKGGLGEMSLEKAKQQSEISAPGIPIEFVEHCWNKCEQRGWVDNKEIPIRSFFGFVRTEWKYEKERRQKDKMMGFGKSKGDERTILEKDIDRQAREIRKICQE